MVKAGLVRKDSALTALLSIAVVATMATVALTVYSDLESKFSREFRSFGANAIAIARDGSLSKDELAQIKSILGEKSEVMPLRYAVVTGEGGQKIVVGGTDLRVFHQLNASWSFNVDPRNIYGKYIDSYPWIGARLAATLLPDLREYDLHYGTKSISIPVGPVF